jgi:hypothetical protein
MDRKTRTKMEPGIPEQKIGEKTSRMAHHTFMVGASLGFVAGGICSTGKSADCSFCPDEPSNASEAIERALAGRGRGAAWIDFPPSSEPIPAGLLK